MNRRIITLIAGLALVPLITFATEFPPPTLFEEAPAEAVVTESGIGSVVLEKGTGLAHPKADDTLALYFKGWSAEGQQLFTNYQDPSPASINLKKTFPAWKEASQMMVEGETRRFWIPQGLRPGAKGQGPAVFDLKLVEILPPSTFATELKNPPADAKTLPLGAKTVRVEAGDGLVQPTEDNAALLNYTGWTADGQVFDSTLNRGRPTMIPLGRVMPAFRECVEQMVVGERRRCWIPGQVAQGNWVGGPKGDLVFDIVLVDIMAGQDGNISVPTTPN